MSYLAKAKKPEARPPMITIVGSPGAGKTTLGALFPGAILLPTEDGTSVFDTWADDVKPAALPRLPKAAKDEVGNMTRSSRAVLGAMMDELLTAQHDYRTLVIDSITSLDLLLQAEIALRDGVGNVADAAGGYHKGYTEVASWHADFIYRCEQLRAAKKMAIVFLAHSGIKKIRNRPDAAADYSVFGLDMDDKALATYVAQSDAVLYIRKEEIVIGQETDRKGRTTKYGRVTQTGRRTIITSGDGQVGYVSAKNRYGMPTEIDLEIGENPIIPFIRFFEEQAK